MNQNTRTTQGCRKSQVQGDAMSGDATKQEKEKEKNL